MRRIIPELTEELAKHFGDPNRIGSSPPFRVKTFRELVEHIAKLSYKNKDHLLFYRGQVEDYKNKAGSSTFYPSIYRGHSPISELINRFDILDGASKVLSELFEKNSIEGYRDLKRRKSIQWCILQHYEVCSTPFTDFTHSLRVACSFAMLDNQGKDAFIFVFGLPYITNRISINSEHDIINIRLLSICPPTALRPYFQEGYLAGTDDITTSFESKTELDFNNRLISKFVISNDDSFWGNGFNKIPKKSLYPDGDPILDICKEVKEIADRELRTGDIGDFLKSWAELEQQILTLTRRETTRFLSFREAIRELFHRREISEELLHQFDRLRVFRNKLVHTPDKVKQGEVVDYLQMLNRLKREFMHKGK